MLEVVHCSAPSLKLYNPFDKVNNSSDFYDVAKEPSSPIGANLVGANKMALSASGQGFCGINIVYIIMICTFLCIYISR